MTIEETKIESVEDKKERRINKKLKEFWVWSKYFAMKWRFRLDQARSLFGLITFAALLAVGYVDIIPWFKVQGFWRGEFLLTVLVLTIFLIGGYLYDRFLKLWTETTTVNVERNPYTYVPGPKEKIVSLGWWVYNYKVLSQIAKKLDIEIEDEDMIKQQLTHYLTLTVEDTDFEVQAKKLQRLTGFIIESYLESDKAGNFDEYMADLEQSIIEKKKKQDDKN